MTDTSRLRAMALLAALVGAAFLGGCDDAQPQSVDWDPPKGTISVAESSPAEAATPDRRLQYDPSKHYEAIVKTTLGPFRLRFFPAETPATVENFVRLSMAEFYDGTIIHRVIADELIQGGDQEGTGAGNPLFRIPDEFTQRQFVAGTVGMARMDEPNSANSQWFVCLKRLPTLDGRYSAFAEVIEGLDVVRKISQVEVEGDRAIAPSRQQRPVDPPTVIEIEIVEAAASR
ncbi:MAG: peptidylprolyl isomerase [Planctomycetes bacterium]|nr:peptidylprolyl isomerase [Planctomycetota bacterium]